MNIALADQIIDNMSPTGGDSSLSDYSISDSNDESMVTENDIDLFFGGDNIFTSILGENKYAASSDENANANSDSMDDGYETDSSIISGGDDVDEIIDDILEKGGGQQNTNMKSKKLMDEIFNYSDNTDSDSSENSDNVDSDEIDNQLDEPNTMKNITEVDVKQGGYGCSNCIGGKKVCGCCQKCDNFLYSSEIPLTEMSLSSLGGGNITEEPNVSSDMSSVTSSTYSKDDVSDISDTEDSQESNDVSATKVAEGNPRLLSSIGINAPLIPSDLNK